MDHFNPGFYEVFNQACLEEKITWTSYRLFGFEVNIGPTVIPYETPCYKCFDLRRKGNLTFYEEYTLLERYLKEHQFPSGYLYITPGIGLAVLEVIKLLTRFVDPATYGKFFSVNLLTLETRLHSILKLPQCPHCGRPAKGRPTIHIWDSKET
jgi:bacteriocin biosynthesis cyclodehydratase domain-containing protein